MTMSCLIGFRALFQRSGNPSKSPTVFLFRGTTPLTPWDARLQCVSATVIEKSWKRIVVDYEGEKLAALPESAPVQAFIAVGQDAQLVQQTVFRNVVTRGWRLSFQIKPPKGKPLELHAYLRNGKNILTETWSYQLEP